MPQSENALETAAKELLEQRIKFLEEQLCAAHISMKYQRSSLSSAHCNNGEALHLLLKLLPYKYRSAQKAYELAYFGFSWKKLLWRHPLNFRLWLAAKRLQRGIKR